MKIFKLTRIAQGPLYDAVFGFVVIAPDEAKARLICTSHAGDEGADYWADPEYSGIECIGETLPECKAGLVLRDYNAG